MGSFPRIHAASRIELALLVCDEIGRSECGDWYNQLFDGRADSVCAQVCGLDDLPGMPGAIGLRPSAKAAADGGSGGSPALGGSRGASGGACSFSGDTEVLLADGTKKKMKDLRVGDIVAATDPETGESGAESITNLWIHEDELRLLSLDGGSVATTNDHPFWNAGDREWQPAEELDAGDALLTHDGRQLVIRGIGADSRSQAAYNLTVANLHTYYVLVGDTPVLVHNTCPKGAKRGPKPAGTGPHNLKIEAVGRSVVDGEIIAGGGVLPERAIATPGGFKGTRRPDILVRRQDGSIYGINVGKKAANGAPIKREAEAISDLEGAGVEMHFVAYN